MPSPHRLLAVALACVCSIGCNNSTRQEAQELADQIQATMAATSPGGDGGGDLSTNPVGLSTGNDTLPDGCYLRANVNGKRWEATGMTPDYSGSSSMVVNGRNQAGFLNFSINGRPKDVGKPRKFHDTHAVMFWDENNEDWFGRSGTVTVHKFDSQFIEGIFNFTAQKDGKTVVCTDGEFRVPNRPRPRPQQ